MHAVGNNMRHLNEILCARGIDRLECRKRGIACSEVSSRH